MHHLDILNVASNVRRCQRSHHPAVHSQIQGYGVLLVHAGSVATPDRHSMYGICTFTLTSPFTILALRRFWRPRTSSYRLVWISRSSVQLHRLDSLLSRHGICRALGLCLWKVCDEEGCSDAGSHSVNQLISHKRIQIWSPVSPSHQDV